MAVNSDAPRDAFRLNILIDDTRYRSMTIQIVVMILFMAGVAWLIDNIILNFRTLGKDFSFGFLWNRAGYDINQRLVEYTNDSNHGRALLVGLTNTLLVAAMGCITATIIGVIAGVLRLSKNWLVRLVMTVYVEIFRNLPLLLWMLLIYAVLTEALPPLRDFRGGNPIATMSLNGSIAITNQYTVVAAPLFAHSLGNIDLAIVFISVDLLAIIAVIVASVLANRALLTRATRIQEGIGNRPVTWWKSSLILVMPLVVLLLALGIHLDYPKLGAFNFSGGMEISNSLLALWLALSLYSGAFIAEYVRAGILAISHGQTDAAFSLGLRPGRTMSLVILPQAQRVIVPPLISQYLSLTKNTSLATAVGYMDVRGTLGGITLNQTGREIECMMLLMLIYLTISLSISVVMNVYNNAVKLKER